MLKQNYLKKQYEQNLKLFVYKSEDHSIFYYYVGSPIAQFCLNHFIPIWMAFFFIIFSLFLVQISLLIFYFTVQILQITVIGFLFIFVPHLIVYAIYGNNLTGYMSPYFCLAIGVAKFIYYTFDNIDGKQARKTGTSSPLGVLFDHGCDALTCLFQGLNISLMLQLDGTIWVLMTYMVGIVCFFFCTLQSYICDTLSLPAINSANEGVLLLICVFLWTFLQGGSNYWLEINCFGYQNNHTIVTVVSIMAIFSIIGSLLQIFLKSSKICYALFKSLFFLYEVGSAVFVFLVLPEEVLKENCRMLIYFFGFLMTKIVTQMHIAHVAHGKFKQFGKSCFILITILNINVFLDWKYNIVLLNHTVLINCFGIISFLVFIHLIFNTARQFTEILEIKMFSINSKKEE